jgi:hypothetical protein
MSNGRPSLSDAIEAMRGQPDRLIAEATGEPLWKVRDWRRAAGLKAYSGRREGWSRRDWLLNEVSGLDFHPALCRP